MNFRAYYLEALNNGQTEDAARIEASNKLARYQRKQLKNRNVNDSKILAGFSI